MVQLYCMDTYVTTNIRITKDDYLRLKEEAAKQRKSLSAVIREKVSEKKKVARKDYAKLLLSIKSDWFDASEIADNRRQVEEQIKKRGWAGK